MKGHLYASSRMPDIPFRKWATFPSGTCDMTSMTEWTYKSLIKPIAPSRNLANVTTQVPSGTCQNCVVIVPDRSKRANGLIKINYDLIDLYPEFPELKASAKAGCGLCRLIRKTIRAKWAVRPMEEWGVGPLREKEGLWDELFTAPWDRKVKIHRMSFLLKDLPDALPVLSDTKATAERDEYLGMVVLLRFEFGPASLLTSSDGTALYGEIGQIVGFKVYDSIDINSANKECQRRLPSLSTLSEANLALISSWISDCKASHVKCRRNTALWVPTRLIYVGSSEDPRLVETAQEGVQEPYAALSHMWGDSSKLPPLRTNMSKYEEMKTGIPMWMLSKNFTDAVIVTRQLGLQYIWIDSLCIIQDSPADWQREAVMMHKVYRYAEITIVATSATSAHDGFLDRDLSMIPATKVAYSLGTESSTSKNFVLSTNNEVELESWMGDVNSCQWNTRGWTHQERSLSTCMLHFCRTKLYFECRTSLKSEENEPLPKIRGFQQWPRYEDWMEPAEKQETDDTLSSLRTRMYKIWKGTVTEYTGRRLTKGSDKLPAIQSIAAEMAAAIQDTYMTFAGMWRGNINDELLWHVQDGPRSAPASYRAPSWSWASLDAKIAWNDGPARPKPSHSCMVPTRLEVIDVTDPRADHSELPSLKVNAYLKSLAFIVECDNDERWVYSSRGTFPYDLFMSTAKPDQHSSMRRSGSVLTPSERQAAIEQGSFAKFAEGNLDFDDKDGLTGSQRVFAYLHVNHMSRPSGLILEWGFKGEGKWKRVGVATVFSIRGDLFSETAFAEDELPVEISIL